MTTATYEDFLSNKEWECFLRGMIHEYARFHPMSIDERQQILRWVLLGNDIHNNPKGWKDDSGKPIDYLDFLRMDPAKQMKKMGLKSRR